MPMISRIYPLSMLTKKSPKHGTRKLITMPMISRIYPLSMRTKKSPKHGTNKKALLTSSCCVDEYDLTAKTEPSDFTEKSLSSDISSFQCAVRFSSSESSTKTEATEVEKYLSFDGNVRVCYTIARSDFSLEETTATWYTTEEYMRISEQCSRQIYKMDEGKVLKGRKYCSRGLETRRGRAIKIQNRSSSIETVLMEQEKQSDEGTYDGVVISRVYRGVTSSCQLWANIVGVRDQRVAEDYLDDINLQMPQTITKEPEQQSKPSILRRKPRQPSILRSKPRPRRNEVAARIA